VTRALDRQEIERALGGLSVRQRQTVVLRDWAGFDTAEVARLLGMREPTVRVHLHRARADLRKALRLEEETAK
jgi:RNA polymerase sigma-70 factor (ECF subfamily)